MLATSDILSGWALIHKLPSSVEYLDVPLPADAITQGEGVSYFHHETSASWKFLSTEKYLGHALQAFGYTHSLGLKGVNRYHTYLTKAAINSMHDLATGSKEGTIKFDLDFIGCPAKDRLDNKTLHLLYNFLPGPLGLRCFRLLQMAADRVEKGLADAKYVHQPKSGLWGNKS